jgi:hypothetical protein
MHVHSRRPNFSAICVISVFTIIAFYVFLHPTVCKADPATGLPSLSSIPSTPIPAINGRDTFNAAEALLIDTDTVATVLPSLTFNQVPNASLSQIDHLIAENQPAIAKLREGLTEDCVCPPIRNEEQTTPYLSVDRQMARVLALQAYDQAEHGNWSDAMTSALDAIALGSKVQHGSQMIGMLVGVAIETTGRKRIYADDIIDHLNADETRQAALRLESIESGETSYADNVEQETWAGEATLLTIFAKPNWREDLVGDGSTTGNSGASDFQKAVATMSPAVSYGLYAKYMNFVEVHAGLSWPKQVAVPLPPVPNDPLCSIMLPMYGGLNFRKYLTRAYLENLDTELALHAYYLDNGSYPAALTQLVPKCLTAVPIDPFSNDQLLKYNQIGNHYLLYSIGPDATDDGGIPIGKFGIAPELAGREPINPVIHDTDKGDIVTGVNF